MEGKNIDDFILMVELIKKYLVNVCFIEEMLFNGEGSYYFILEWNFCKIVFYFKDYYFDLEKIFDFKYFILVNYKVFGY